MSISSSLRFVSAAVSGVSGLLLCTLLTGCGIGELDRSVTPQANTISISGKLMGGEIPISGSTVQLWQTGSCGYADAQTNASTAVAGCTAPVEISQASSVTSVGTGAFSFSPANVPANCDDSVHPSYAYITATGGDSSGSNTTNYNNAILLVAMLNLCDSTGASTSIVVNEMTTVAAAYAMSGFASTAGGGIGTSSTTPGTLYIGAPTTNYQGLKDAVANSQLLVNSTYGQAVPSSATVLHPSATLNSLGNIIADCVQAISFNSSLTDCTTIFGYATPPVASPTTPTNTFQALLNIAQYPGNQVANLVTYDGKTGAPWGTLILANSSTTSVVNDFSLGLEYLNSNLQSESISANTASGLSESPFLAIDSTDNVWALGFSASSATTASTTSYNDIFELTSSSAGSVASDNYGTTAALNATHNIRNAVFDKFGNLWASDGSAADSIEIPYTTSLSPASASLTSYASLNSSMALNTWAIASDSAGNIYSASYKGSGSCNSATHSGGSSDCEFLKATYSAGPTYTAGITVDGTAGVSSYTVRDLKVDSRSASSTKGYIWSAQYGNSSGAGNLVQVVPGTSGTINSPTAGASGSGPWGVALDANSGGWVTTNAIAGLYYVAAGGGTNGVAASTASATGVAVPSSVASGYTTASIGWPERPGV